MDCAVTSLPLEVMDLITSGFSIICPFSYKDLWLFAKKGDKVLITNNPKEVEQLFGRVKWFDYALPQAIQQHLAGCLTENIQIHLTHVQ